MASIGLCGSDKETNLNHEKAGLHTEALKQYDDVVLIDPRLVAYKFTRGEDKPQILYKGRDISSLDSLIVRGSKGRSQAVTLLVRSLDLCGCDIFDPVDRFVAGHDTKMLTTVERFQKKVGTTSYFAFARASAEELLRHLDDEKLFPLLTKPVAGRQGQGVVVLKTLQDGLNHLDEFFADEKYVQDPLYLQSFEQFKHEYRVLIVDGVALGAAEKVKAEGVAAANAAQGGTFIKADVPDVIAMAVKSVSDQGILGVDVAVDAKGQLHIIEANRAPQWHTFEEATGINVPEYIIARAKARLK